MQEFQDLPPSEIIKKLDRAFNNKYNLVDAGHGCLLPKRYREISDKVRNFEIRSDDVFLCSFPRTGSTWLQEILWLLGNDLNFEAAGNTLQVFRNPTIELSCLYPENEEPIFIKESMKGNTVDFCDQMKGRRFIKTHLPWHLLPDQLKNNPDTKIVYTMRNPKDQVVSFYHYCILAYQITCSFDEFMEFFLANKMCYGSSALHMAEYYKRRHQSNVLVVRYEDMKRDLPSVIQQCADHLEINRTLTTDDIDKLCEHVKFEKMEKNSCVNLEPIVFAEPEIREKIDDKLYNKVKFIRKGKVGDWQNYFSPELNDKFDKWIEENLDTTGITFDYN